MKALITGVTGQDGSYLSELLIKKGYEVYGIVRRSSSFNTSRICHIKNSNFNLIYGDITDTSSLSHIINQIKPDEIYHLAAQSHVAISFEMPEYTVDSVGVGTLRLLEAIRMAGLEKKVKMYNAITSELFGLVQETPQKETTPFYPRSPYGVAKLYSYWISKNYREAYNMFVTNGILFNHESERRGENFVTRKITLAASRIKHKMQDCLYLGNLNAERDWGYAPDYVEAMWRMLQLDNASDYVVSTGEKHSVREFCELAFKEASIYLTWDGEGVNEKGLDRATGKVVVAVDPKYFRPTEVELLIGDPSKAIKALNWNPNQTKFQEIVSKMMRHDLEYVTKITY